MRVGASTIKSPGYAYAKIQEFFIFGYFLFNQSKNYAVLEPMTGHFRGLVGFEVKAKDLSFKAKDFKMCPGGVEDVLEAKDILEDSTSAHAALTTVEMHQ